MYERSAIVLEKNYNSIFGLDQKINMRTIYKDYKELVEEIQKYQSILNEENTVINEFDKIAGQIKNVQIEQKNIYKLNYKLEEERNELFDDIDAEASDLEKKLTKIEDKVKGNNALYVEIRKQYVNLVSVFNDKQKERNAVSKNRRTEEKKYFNLVDSVRNDFEEIDEETVQNLREFVDGDNQRKKREIIILMMNNGKDERVPFNRNVIESAVNARNDIAEKEAKTFIAVYDRMKNLLNEIDNDDIKLDKYKKTLRDSSVKLAFLKAEKMYIASFLDNERVTAIGGEKAHNKLMDEACANFSADMEQFKNLEQLILREIASKSTKKAYRELYNKQYLRNIEENERNVEKQINNMNVSSGAVINSNYWRISEIKNVYEVFQEEVSEKFNRDLSDFKLEETADDEDDIEPEDEEQEEEDYDEYVRNRAKNTKTKNSVISEETDDIFKTQIPDDDVEYVEEFDLDDDDDSDKKSDVKDDSDEEYYDDDYDYDDTDEYSDDEEDYDDSEEDYEDSDADDEYDDSDEEYEDDDSEDSEEYEDEEEEEIKPVSHIKQKGKRMAVAKKESKKKKDNGLFNKFFK